MSNGLFKLDILIPESSKLGLLLFVGKVVMAPHPCVITNFQLNYQVHKTRYTLFFTEAFFISTGILFTPILYTIIKWQLIYLCHINHFNHNASYHTTAPQLWFEVCVVGKQ